MKLKTLPLAAIKPYERNPRRNDDAVDAVAESIRQCSYVAPIIVDENNAILAGHTRWKALQKLGRATAQVCIADGLTEEQKRKYRILDNKTAEIAEWDDDLLRIELDGLDFEGFDFGLLNLTAEAAQQNAAPEITEDDGHFWESDGESTKEYDAFLEKFKPKLTTDDCYTPANVYAAVSTWAVNRYGLENAEIIRPFYPGGDYQAADYPAGCVVIDNPPFSILSEICAWYEEHRVRYFLFCPGLTTFSINSGKCNYLPCGISIMFDNGAEIAISFLTNIGDVKIEIAPDLYEAVDAANKINLAKVKASFPTYSYPDAVCSVAINKLAKWGQALRVNAEDAHFIRYLDNQKAAGKAIYGGGFLLSEKAAAEKAAAEKAAAEKAAAEKAAAEKAAAEKAAAEKAAAEKAAAGIPPDGVWELSERERALVASMGKHT